MAKRLSYLFLIVFIGFVFFRYHSAENGPAAISDDILDEEIICDNLRDAEQFENPIPVVWTAGLDGCLAGCAGASFTRIPADGEFPRFAGYYMEGAKIPDEFLREGLILKITGKWRGIEEDHSRTVFGGRCVPVIDIIGLEVL